MDNLLNQIDIKSLISNGFGGFVGGLAGAFFAFIFTQIYYGLTSRKKGWVNYYNTLVRLEHFLNERMTDIEVNKYMLNTYVEGMENINENNIVLFWGRPRKYGKNENVMTDLQNMDLKNQVFDLFDEFDRLNDDIEANMEHYSIARSAYISKSIKEPQMAKSSKAVSTQFEILIRGHEYLDEKVNQTLALTRILLKKDLPISLLRYYRIRKSNEVNNEEIQIELKRISEEIEGVRNASKARIQYVMGKSTDFAT